MDLNDDIKAMRHTLAGMPKDVETRFERIVAAALSAATAAQSDTRDAEIERLRDEKDKLERAWFDTHRLEHAAEAAECVAMALDKAGVPKGDGKGNDYSLWGRVQQFAALAAATAAQPENLAGVHQDLLAWSSYERRATREELEARLKQARKEADAWGKECDGPNTMADFWRQKANRIAAELERIGPAAGATGE